MNNGMNRRRFLQLLVASGLATGLPVSLRARAAEGNFTPYSGPFFVSIEAGGGWDVTSFCDPKANPAINHWASTQGVQTISGSSVTYAPFAHNQRFFSNLHPHMLVVNGIDAQTNAHQAGQRYNWSGRLAEGYPSFAALAAAVYGAGLPLAYLSNGGYNQTAGIINYTLMQDPGALNKLVYQDQFLDGGSGWDAAKYFHRQSTRDIINRHRAERLARLQAAQPHMASRMQAALNQFSSAKDGQQLLELLAQYVPQTLVDYTDADGYWNPLLRQAQIALAAYQSGLCVSTDLVAWGFDTHANHDADHAAALMRLQNGVEYLWAEAGRLGIDDKLVVMISSDFARTPGYNDGNGKDHWPIGSTIFMSKNASWANRSVGLTTAAHEAQTVNAQTLAPDSNGILLQPKHIQQAMRELAGIAGHELSQRFPLNAESVNLFGQL
ncbi:DUF1501 domain-containing protein [Thalassolituus alkanivorans]|uniref:DUF1501 domain-containing protein n=1 Tax=Thalassolituus alkanivorans TaxID=2881055 RepID=UPI001E2A7E01|nr:DUF1501 domain-containing protein [Thalassolituus alkanivorans]MCB2388432.1 DUF1501 domain-containing protein [Thalassolituus alkanivorans]MCB2423850.1 DUF1501 domain-containing protein [Thalassolituus alkanivorans]